MVPVIRKSLYSLVMGMLLMAGISLSTSSAQAQCNSITVYNTVGCDLSLCLYSLSTAAPLCWYIPAGPPTVITVPAGWIPAGAVSQGSNQYPFSATGCTVCYRQFTPVALKCCAEVCYDPSLCIIKIVPCATALCNP